jgi:beta-lactamase regulating signal transducer with metallopeptidase domain
MNTSTFLVDTIALSLLHFLWQGAAIAALAGALMLVLRRPATRYLVGIGALGLMLVSFGTTVYLLSSGDSAGELLSARAPAAALASPKVADVTSLSMLWTSQAANSSDAFVWMARAWFAGVVVFALRIVFGLLAIERLRRRSLIALSPRLIARFEALQARLGIERVIRYCQCEGVSVPAVVGVFRPIVLLPLRALTGLSAEQLDAVIAHELGHILRFDVAVNFLQVFAETLLFFHPAVWWLNRRIRADREDCCDDVAVAACGSRVTYARALASMEGWRETPSFAMAATGGTVAARVARLLGVSRGERGERATRAIAAMLVLTASLAAGVVSLGVALPAGAQTSESDAPAVAAEPAVPAEPAEPAIPAVPALEAVPPVPAVPELTALPPVPDVPEAEPPPPPLPAAPVPTTPQKEAKPVKEAKPAPEPKAARAPKAEREPKVEREPKALREPKTSREPKVDRAEKVVTRQVERTDVHQDVQVEVREEVRVNQNENHSQNQNHNSNVDVQYAIDIGKADAAAALGHMDVTPEYIRDIRATGLHAELADLIALRSLGVSADYVAQMRALGIKGDAAEIIAMKSQAVAPDYLKALIAAGIRVDAYELIQAHAMGITPETMEHARKLGIENLSFDKLMQLKSAAVL